MSTNNKDLRHEIHNLLYAVKSAYRQISSQTPNLQLAEENLKAAIERLEQLAEHMTHETTEVRDERASH